MYWIVAEYMIQPLEKDDLWSYFQNYSHMLEWVVAYTLWLLFTAQNRNTVQYLDSDTFSIVLALHSNTWGFKFKQRQRLKS